jgi:hypothetical protein
MSKDTMTTQWATPVEKVTKSVPEYGDEKYSRKDDYSDDYKQKDDNGEEKKYGRHDDKDGDSSGYAENNDDREPSKNACKPDPCNAEPASYNSVAWEDADVSDLHGVLASMSAAQAVDFAIDYLGATDSSFDTAHFDPADPGQEDSLA